MAAPNKIDFSEVSGWTYCRIELGGEAAPLAPSVAKTLTSRTNILSLVVKASGGRWCDERVIAAVRAAVRANPCLAVLKLPATPPWPWADLRQLLELLRKCPKI